MLIEIHFAKWSARGKFSRKIGIQTLDRVYSDLNKIAKH